MKPIALKARAVVFHETGGPDVLRIEEIEVPAPGPGQVRIRPKAVGINRADSMYRSGKYVETTLLPGRFGYEAAGIVESVGPDVNDILPGEIVSVIPAFSLHDYAMQGELVLVPAYAIEKHPHSIDFIDAAALWTNYLAAYGALVDEGKLSKGQYAVINAASSGVGLAAIQIANAVGAVPIALTTSLSKKQALLNAGAKHVIVTNEQNLLDEQNLISGGKGIDVIIDAVGGIAFSELVSSAAYKGHIVIYGTLSSVPAPVSIMDILAKNLTIRGFTLADVLSDAERQNAAKNFIYNGIGKKLLKPTIAKTFPFDDIIEAHKFLESNKQVGKIVVTF